MRLRFLLVVLLLAWVSEARAHQHGEGCGCAHHHDHHHNEDEIFSADDGDDNSPPRVLIEEPTKETPSKPSYWIKLAAQVQEATPWVILGALLVSVLSILPLPLDFLQSQLSGQGILSTIKASILGLATPLCSCGSLPIAAGLLQQGVPLSSVVAFLTASQSAGLDSALITYGLLGPTATAWRLVGALVLSVVAGTVLQSSSATNNDKLDKKHPASSNEKSPAANGLVIVRVANKLIDTAMEIFPLVFIGLAISTAAAHYIPKLAAPLDPSLAAEKQYAVGDFLLRLAVIASALPLQLCEHSTAALAASIQKAGGGAGLAFSFLLSAPATNIPSLLLLASSSHNLLLTCKVALSLTVTALALSYSVDIAGVDLLVDKDEAGGTMGTLPRWFVDASPYIAGVLVAAGVFRMIMWKVLKTREDCSCPTEKKVN